MTNEEILEKAIEKALKSGWKTDWLNDKGVWVKDECWGDIFDGHCNGIYGILFDPEWAKAFWSEEFVECRLCQLWIIRGLCYCKEAWDHHQHKLLEEIQEGRDPVSYLEQFI